MENAKGLLRWAVRQVIFLVLLGAVLFLSAGTFAWMRGWILVAITAATQIINAVLFIPKHADLLIERSQIREGTNKRDILLAFLMAYSTVFIALAGGLDFRFSGAVQVPVWLFGPGLVLILSGVAFTDWAMLENAYFSGVVRIQKDRGHRVISSGPYRFVRHPGYVGMLLYLLAVPLVVGSWWAYLPSGLALVVTFIRTRLEDDYLKENLDGYTAYAGRVRFRLVPFIW